jgi:hypothetical protein
MMAPSHEPIETLAVTFFDQPVLAARIPDGTIVLSIRDLCAVSGLNQAAQVRRLRRDDELRDGLHRLRVQTAGGPQDQDFLMLEFVPAWLSSVSRARATPMARERLRYLRVFAIRHVYDAVARAAGLPEGASRQIEDLRELDRFDAAFQGIAERQQALEESQEKARQAWRNHEQRIRQLEEQLGAAAILSVGQRGHIYQLVQAWALARVEQEQISSQAAFAGCWAAVKTRYNVSKYEHIPARQYEDCVQYIRRSYEKLTGQPLVLPEENDDGDAEAS